MPPKTRKKTRRKLTRPMSSKYHPVQPPKSRKQPVRKDKPKTTFLPVRTIYRDQCESAWNDYKQGAKLGSGTAGSVYELCDEQKECPYVLKVEEDVSIQQFTHEVEYQHKARAFAPKILDAWICTHVSGSKQVGFIVMERVDGTLRDYLSDNSITMEFAKKLMKTIRSHVSKLHNMGLVHGDLHDENIFYKGKRWLLGDFGNAGYVFSLPQPFRKLLQAEDEESLQRVKLKIEDAYLERVVIIKKYQ